jgi:putative hydrolase of the HAD superfamily
MAPIEANPEASPEAASETKPEAKIEALLLDYGQVLSLPPDPVAWERLKAVFSAEEAPFDRAYWKPRDEYDRGDLNAPTYWAAVARALGAELSEPMLQQLIATDIDLWTRPNAPMIAWVEQMRQRGLRIGLLSNIGDAMEFGVTERMTWLASFHSKTFSHRYGLIKPEAAIFDIAALELGVAKERTLFIDDKAVNVEAARQAGMQAARYTTHPQFLQLLKALGHTDLLPADA